MPTITSSVANADDGGRLLSSGYAIAASVVVITLGVIAVFIWAFSAQPISLDSERWAQFGDYLGGIINPVVGLATVILVLINIKIQRLELQASLAQLKISNAHTARQSFEQSLFAWLGVWAAEGEFQLNY